MSLLTVARDLRRRKARERHRLFVVEGVRGVEELLRSAMPVRGALVTREASETPRVAALIAQLDQREMPVEQVGASEFDSAAETESPQGILAMATASRTRDCPTCRFMTRCGCSSWTPFRIRGTSGRFLRTAAAFGVTATFSLPGTVDLWNAKVVRSAMGAHFHHSCLTGTWDELDSFRREHAIALWAADAAGESIEGSRAASPPGTRGRE